MTLEEAEAEVRSWWIPELDARIVRSAYVTKADVAAALAPGVGFVRHELPGLGNSYCGYTVYELTGYQLPKIVEVP